MNKTLKKIWDNLEDYIAAAGVAIMVILLFAQVFARFVLRGSITWSEEQSRFAFIWFMFLSSSIAAKYRLHIRVTAPLLALPKPARRLVILFVDLLWIAFNILMVILGIQKVLMAMRFVNLSPSLQINMVWMYLVIPISFFLMTIRIIEGYINEFRGKQEPYDI